MTMGTLGRWSTMQRTHLRGLGWSLGLLSLSSCGLVGGSQTDSESHFLACEDDSDCAASGTRCREGQCGVPEEPGARSNGVLQEPQLLAEMDGGIAELRESGDYLYWLGNTFPTPYGTTGGDLKRMPKSSGEVATLVENVERFAVGSDA